MAGKGDRRRDDNALITAILVFGICTALFLSPVAYEAGLYIDMLNQLPSATELGPPGTALAGGAWLVSGFGIAERESKHRS